MIFKLVSQYLDLYRALSHIAIIIQSAPLIAKNIGKAYYSGSQPGCRGTLGCHLQCPGVPRANAFFNILLKLHFQTVIKP